MSRKKQPAFRYRRRPLSLTSKTAVVCSIPDSLIPLFFPYSGFHLTLPLARATPHARGLLRPPFPSPTDGSCNCVEPRWNSRTDQHFCYLSMVVVRLTS